MASLEADIVKNMGFAGQTALTDVQRGVGGEFHVPDHRRVGDHPSVSVLLEGGARVGLDHCHARHAQHPVSGGKIPVAGGEGAGAHSLVHVVAVHTRSCA